jgi:hypothetical protein
VDPFGRVFLPDAFQFSVMVIDNNKNEILRFGEYGNPDQHGPGSSIPSPAIPLTYPMYVQKVNNSVYISDAGSHRVVRVKLDYAMWATTSGKEKVEVAPISRDLDVKVYPVPFTPGVNVAVNLVQKEPVSLSIYGLNGQLIRTYKSRKCLPGRAVFHWDGKDNSGIAVSAGMYIAKLSVGRKIFCRHLLMAK